MLDKGSQLEPLYPDDPNIQNLLGVVNAALQNHEEAITHYNKAIKLKPDYAEAHYNLGNTFYTLKKFKRAINKYRQAVLLLATYTHAYVNLGNIFSDTEHFGCAILNFKRATVIRTDIKEAQINIANNLLYTLEVTKKPKHFALVDNPYSNARSLGCFYIQGKRKNTVRNYWSSLKKTKIAYPWLQLAPLFQINSSREIHSPFCPNPLDFLFITNLVSLSTKF